MKSFKKILFSVISIIVILSSSNSFSMYDKLRAGIKAGFPAFCTGLHWYLAASPFVDEAARLHTMKKRDLSKFLKPANPAVKQFVVEQLTAIQMPNPEQVQVFMDPTAQEGIVGNNGKDIIIGYGDMDSLQLTGEPSRLVRAITDKKVMGEFLAADHSRYKSVADYDQKKEIEKLIERTEELSEIIDQALNQYKFCVQQQGVQLKDKRSETMIAVNLAAPLLTHWSIKGARKLLVAAKALNQPQPATGILRNLLRLPAGVGKGLVSGQAVYAVDRAMETNADNKVAADMHVLRGGAEFFEQRDAQLRATLSQRMKGAPVDPQSAGYRALEFFANPRHPSMLVRAANLRERARQAHLKKFDAPATAAVQQDD